MNPFIQLARRLRGAIQADQSNAVPASIIARAIAVVIAVPLIQIGFWLSVPGLLVSRAGQALAVACLERKKTFSKN